MSTDRWAGSGVLSRSLSWPTTSTVVGMTSRAVRRVIITSAAGALTYLVSVLAGPVEPALAVTLASLVAGVVLLTQFLVDVEARLLALETSSRQEPLETRDLIRFELSRIDAAGELFAQVEQSALDEEAVRELVRHAARIPSTVSPLLAAFAMEEVQRVSTVLKSLGDGVELDYEGEDRDWLLGLTQSASQSIDAVSIATVDSGGTADVDAGLWTSDLGQRYLEAQREAVERGVVIRRVFVLDRPELVDDAGLRALAALYLSIGVEIRAIDGLALARIRRSSLFDFVIYDDALSYELTPAARIADDARQAILTTRLVLRPERVADRQHRFQEIWAAAREVP